MARSSARQPDDATTRGDSPAPDDTARLGHRALLEEVAVDTWLRLIWDAAPDAMVLSDPEGIVLMANSAYCELYGYAPEELVGRSYAVIFPPEQRTWAMEQYRATFASPIMPPVHEVWIRRKDGTERFVQARAELVVGGGHPRAMLSIIRDVTERKQAEEARLRAGQMEQRLDGITLAVRELAHLLNNDLALAVGTLDLLQEGSGLSPAEQGSVRTALDALDAIAQHLAKFHRVVRVETQETPIGPMLDIERSI